MHLWCERFSAVIAGILVGKWYKKTFPEEKPNDKKGKKQRPLDNVLINIRYSWYGGNTMDIERDPRKKFEYFRYT